jgi:hypothetical protein
MALKMAITGQFVFFLFFFGMGFHYRLPYSFRTATLKNVPVKELYTH